MSLSASNQSHILAGHHGLHPIYDAHARIVDLECFDSLVKKDASIAMQKCNTNLDIGSLIPSHAVTSKTVSLGSDREIRECFLLDA